jgi:hypothetical protein
VVVMRMINSGDDDLHTRAQHKTRPHTESTQLTHTTHTLDTFMPRVQPTDPPTQTARHAGFFADVAGVYQWVATINSADARFYDDETRQSVVFMRC